MTSWLYMTKQETFLYERLSIVKFLPVFQNSLLICAMFPFVNGHRLHMCYIVKKEEIVCKRYD